MKYLRLAIVAALCTAASAFAQNAILTANTTTLVPSGGSVVLTATANYDGEPGALGWAIALPANWTLESVSGPNLPAISPEVGTTGTLEFAFTNVPPQRAEFTVIVRYPAGASSATATPTVLLRGGGKLTTLKPAAIQMRTPDSGPPQRSRN